VEKIHHTWSFGSDATVLDDYALTTTTTTLNCASLKTPSSAQNLSLYPLHQRSYSLFCVKNSQIGRIPLSSNVL